MPGKDITKNYVRERQIDPSRCDSRSFRIKEVPHRKDKKLLVCCPKGHYKKGRCKVSTILQSKLTRR